MASFRWIGGSASTGFVDQGTYETAANWDDLTTGVTGDAVPGPGDTATITGVANSEI